MQVFTQEELLKLQKLLHTREIPGENEQRLWGKVKKYTPLLSKIPGVLCVCVCNSLAMNACHLGSDIDLFVITKKNRLWTVRILMTFFFFLTRQRKTRTQHAEKFCLSFFITQDAANFESFALKNDIYLAYWMQTLVPIINVDQSFELFQEKNKWYEFEGKNTSEGIFIGAEIQKGNFIGNSIESMLKRIFLPRTQKSFEKLSKPFGVIISDTILKFHDQDRRNLISKQVFEE